MPGGATPYQMINLDYFMAVFYTPAKPVWHKTVHSHNTFGTYLSDIIWYKLWTAVMLMPPRSALKFASRYTMWSILFICLNSASSLLRPATSFSSEKSLKSHVNRKHGRPSLLRYLLWLQTWTFGGRRCLNMIKTLIAMVALSTSNIVISMAKRPTVWIHIVI